MTMGFAKLGNDSYPKRDFDGGEDQSYGFQPAYKLQTGTMRGTQGVGTQGVVVDSARKRIGINKLENTDNDYAVKLTADGLSITDGIITFISITKDGIVLNDGTTDRILIGKDEGGF